MNSKIITVWGGNGSGKTTVAANLANAIAEREYTVGLVSANLYCGELQGIFAKRVEPDKGTYQAIQNGCNTKNMFSDTLNPNLFFLSVPNGFDGMLMTALSANTVTDLLEDCAIRFDYIIIDGSTELNNPISTIGLTMSGTIVEVHRASAKDCLWNISMENIKTLLHLKEKTITVLNGYDQTCDKVAYLSSVGIKFDFELPYISNAKVLENAGKLIYYSKSVPGGYKKTVQRLASSIFTGGVRNG